MATDVPVVVIGGGQAGLAASYCLAERGVEHIVLDRAGVGDSWRNRWDSFCLVTPNWTLDLPGYPYDGHQPDGYLPRDEIAAYLRRYAASFHPPLVSPVQVDHLSPLDGRWAISTDQGGWKAPHVVVATGPFQRPFLPQAAASLTQDIFQLHSQQYQNPATFPPGGVLVVGSGQSGCQIADDLLAAGREVWLSVGSAERIPRRYRGRETFRWLVAMGMFSKPVQELPDGEQARFKANPHVSGKDGGKDLDLRAFGEAGVQLVGRLLGVQGTSAVFADDVSERLAGADAGAARFQEGIDQYIAAAGVEAPPDDRVPIEWEPDGTPTEVDLVSQGISSVVWATGYRLDFSWIEAPVFGERSYPIQQQGVTDLAGLYFLGLVGLQALGSGLFFGVGKDARHLAAHIDHQL